MGRFIGPHLRQQRQAHPGVAGSGGRVHDGTLQAITTQGGRLAQAFMYLPQSGLDVFGPVPPVNVAVNTKAPPTPDSFHSSFGCRTSRSGR
jgi:hypothetical protein